MPVSVPPNTTFYIARHGLALRGAGSYGSQILTAQLLPEGLPAVQRLATFLADQDLPIETMYCSPVDRCQQTARQIVADASWSIQTDARLHEQYNETLGDVVDRVLSWLDEVSAQQPPVVVACTHGAVISVLTHHILRRSGQIDELDYPKPAGLRVIRAGQLMAEHDFSQGEY